MPMKATIKQFVAMRESLQAERDQLLARLAEINAALGIGNAAPAAPAAVAVSAARAARQTRRTGKRIRNILSLKAAVTKVTKEKAMTKDEILGAIAKLGYRFNTANPVSSLNSVLYSKRQFKNVGGKFSPA
jgi:hypothetical protein